MTNSRHAESIRASIVAVELAEPELLRALGRGDPNAFDQVYERLRAPLHSFLVRLSTDRELAEDLLQETWLRLARHAASLPHDTNLRAWLFTVARNLYRSHRRWSLLDADRLRDWGFMQSESRESPFEALAASAEQRAVERALASLPAPEREVLLLCAWSGFEPAEAAVIIGIRADAVRQRLSRARAKLRERLRHMELSFA
ncbi:MAG TPA: RNA polymerase sigma factor [Polyangiaceae bacterium]|nr:RNA polymerase sigma factor [Polyangiaceae bacterium]